MTTVQDKSTNNYLTVLVIPVDQFNNNVFCLIDDLYNSLITAPLRCRGTPLKLADGEAITMAIAGELLGYPLRLSITALSALSARSRCRIRLPQYQSIRTLFFPVQNDRPVFNESFRSGHGSHQVNN